MIWITRSLDLHSDNITTTIAMAGRIPIIHYSHRITDHRLRPFVNRAPGDFYVMFVNLFVRDFRFKMFVYFPGKVYINGKYAIFCILRNRKG